jgi:hypothetical protein
MVEGILDCSDLFGSIKDPGIWHRTKKQLENVPGFTLKVVAAIAQAELERHLGLP